MVFGIYLFVFSKILHSMSSGIIGKGTAHLFDLSVEITSNPIPSVPRECDGATFLGKGQCVSGNLLFLL